jgi:hypothetical protein
MAPPQVGSLSLVLLGVVGTFLTIAGYGFGNTPLTPGQPELVTVILLLTTLGFVMTGVVRCGWADTSDTQYRVIPALTLGLVGIMAIFGSLVVFQPWNSRGFGRTITVLITSVLSILGAWIAVISYRWYRQQEFRYPIAILSGILSVGLFHRFAQQFDPTIPVPVVALIVALTVVVPVMSVLYVLQPQTH